LQNIFTPPPYANISLVKGKVIAVDQLLYTLKIKTKHCKIFAALNFACKVITLHQTKRALSVGC